jgi:hypothetical protein
MSWLGTWANRLKLSITNTVVDATLTDFPVMVKLSTASGIGDVDVSAYFDELTSDANRKKIALTSSDGTTQLYCEIELHDDANEVAWLHIKVPSVSSSAATILYLYYDSSQSDNTTYIGDTTDAVTHNVWDANFAAVYHMAQDPNGDVADAIKDSTSNANDGTPDGTMLTADLVSGQVGDAIDFDGSDDLIEVAYSEDLQLISGNYSIECLFSSDLDLDVESNDWALAHMGGATNINSWVYKMDTTNDTMQFVTFSSASVVQDNVFGNNSSWNVDQYYHAALVFNGTGYQFYLDGSDDGSTAGTDNPGVNTDASVVTTIGSAYDGDQPFDGKIDEVRISSTARSAAWIKATYNSLWDSLVTFDFDVDVDVDVEATTATLTITANAATISTDIDVEATTATLTITPNHASVNSVEVAATTAALSLATHAAAISLDLDVLCTPVALAIASQTASVALDIDVLATSKSLSITPYDVEIAYDIDITATTESLAIAAQTTTISYDINVDSILYELTITPNASVITFVGPPIDALQLKLVQQVKDIIQDTTYSYDNILDWLNEAQRLVAGGVLMVYPDRTQVFTSPLELLETSDTVTAIPSAAYVVLPSDYGRELFYIYNETTESFVNIVESFGGLLNNSPVLEQSRNVTDAVIEGNRLYYQGIPDDSQTLRLYYYRDPKPMATYISTGVSFSGTTISDSNNGFGVFCAGQTVDIYGPYLNYGNHTVVSVESDGASMVVLDALSNEDTGFSVTIRSRPDGIPEHLAYAVLVNRALTKYLSRSHDKASLVPEYNDKFYRAMIDLETDRENVRTPKLWRAA